MAFGDNDNNQRKFYEPSVYSGYAMSNTDGIDPSALNYQFVNGLMKISIAPMLPNAKPGDRELWDRDNAAVIWLTHTKARMLAEEIKYVMAHPDEVNNGGVPSGSDGLVSFSTGKELGATSPCLIIRKLDPNDGTVVSSYAYQFKSEYHYSIRNFDKASKDFDKFFYNDLEIDQFVTLLESYYQNMTGAVAYGVLYGAKYDIQKNHTKMKLIMDKLGIEQNPEYSKGGNNYNNRSFFSKNDNGGNGNNLPNANSGMRQSTIDDIGN